MYTAIILAAGKGARTTLSVNKTNLLLDHKPLYKHSVDVFKSAGVNVVLVINKDDEEFIKNGVTTLFIHMEEKRVPILLMKD